MGQVKHGAENEGFLWKNEKNREVGFMTDLGKIQTPDGTEKTSLSVGFDFLAVASRLPCCGIAASLLWHLDFLAVAFGLPS